MALVQGIHILAHGDKAEAGRIAIDIQQHQRLLVGVNSVPIRKRDGTSLGFFRIPGAIGSCVHIHVLAFINLE
jgi:hypothetical protein